MYDNILYEEELETKASNFIPFYKTANPRIFKPILSDLKYDICFPANFTQLRYKNQERFIAQISESEYLKTLKIVSVGNKPEIGKNLCKKYGVTNIEFKGHLDRPGVNKVLNQSKFGLCYSNRLDGTPRVITEILCSGTPLLLFNKTRCLKYYKYKGIGVIEFTEKNLEDRIRKANGIYESFKNEALMNIENLYPSKICRLNWSIWKQKIKG